MDFRAPRVGSDSTAAKGAASRHGLGKLKHLESKHLWVQEAVRAKRLVIVKEDTDADFADLMTKHSRRRGCFGSCKVRISSSSPAARQNDCARAGSAAGTAGDVRRGAPGEPLDDQGQPHHNVDRDGLPALVAL